MLFDARLFAEATITLVVIMDPPGTIPVFLSLVGRRPRPARVRAARQAVLVSLGVISLFARRRRGDPVLPAASASRRCRARAGCCCC